MQKNPVDNYSEEDLAALLMGLSSLPDGWETISKGHILCTPFWFKKHVVDPDLSFTDAAKRYCHGVKTKDALITTWDGITAMTRTQSQTTTQEQQERCAAELNSWFSDNGFSSYSFGME